MIRILFVCTGNICRSPTAEALAALALPDERAVFTSAGLHALEGAPASRFAVEAAAEAGADLSDHAAAQATASALAAADLIYTMTERHRQDLAGRAPDLREKIELLDPDGTDIADPYGGTLEDYRRSRDHIAAAVARRADGWRALAAGS